jgi:ferrous iron transport protein A
MSFAKTEQLPHAVGRGKEPQIKAGEWLMPLSAVRMGETVRVKRLRGKEETRRFLKNLGFVQEAEATVVTELGGNVIVHIKGARIAVSKAVASLVWTVER